MAIVPGFQYDIFVSYSHVDNQQGWVSEFEECLRMALRQRVKHSNNLRIFFDREAVGANDHLATLLTAVRQSAIFLAIGSPSFIDSEWTGAELKAFAEQTSDLSRLFLIEFLPLGQFNSYPWPIQDHIRLEFWQEGKYRHAPISLRPTADNQEYISRLSALAVDVGNKLTSLAVLPSSVSSRPSAPVPSAKHDASSTASGAQSGISSNGNRKVVLLAQSTDDVEDEAEKLRPYLKQFENEVLVLPAMCYPQGGDAFREAVRADMAQAGLFVQLLGRRAGRTPPDLPEGYTHFQLEAAKSANIPIMQWRHPDIDVNAIADPDYRSLLTAETVVASGLEAFKQQILSWVRTPQAKPRVTRSSTVFINADARDMEIAKEVERECLRKALTTILPMSSPSAEANLKDLEENLTECDVLVFIYGETTEGWIRSQLRRFSKIKSKREADPRLLAICSGPPPKGDIGISFPNAQLINCPDGWNLGPIRELISGIA